MTQATTVTEVAKQPTKKAQALEIFNARLVERSQGLFASNKEFRLSTVAAIQAALGVSITSAAAHYNTCKLANEALNPALGLGRDPKKVKPASSGKRGRPVGSKNKSKEVVAPAPDAEAAQVAEAVA